MNSRLGSITSQQGRQRAPKRLQYPNFMAGQAYQVVNDGRRAFQQGYVVSVEKTADNSYKCLVKQNEDSDIHYTVKFTTGTDWIEHRSCTCGSEKFAVCSHIMAALYQAIKPEDVTNRPIQLSTRSAPTSQLATPSSQKSSPRLTQLYNPNPIHRPVFEEAEEESKRYQDNGEDSFPREAVCPICLNPWEIPVTMPCGTHSVCQKCAEGLYDHCNKIVGKRRIIACPLCRTDSLMWEVESRNEFVPNSDILRLTGAYERDKARWEKRVLQASAQKEDLKSLDLTQSSASSKDSLATLERKVEHCYEVLQKKYNNAKDVFQGVLSKKTEPGADTK